MLEIIVLVAVALALFSFGVYAMRKSDEIREEMLKEFQADEDGNLEVYESSADLSSPILPFPNSVELGITKGSKLERLYNHLTTNGYLSENDYKHLKITRSAGFIYRLRKMGFTIATEKDKEGKFIQYKLICYKLK